MYLPGHKLAIEADEKEHLDRKKEKEEKGKNKIEKKVGWKFIRINPDSEKFNVNIEIGETYNHINELDKKITEQLTKNSLIDNLSRRLSELEFEENHSIKSKCLKYVVKEILLLL